MVAASWGEIFVLLGQLRRLHLHSRVDAADDDLLVASWLPPVSINVSAPSNHVFYKKQMIPAEGSDALPQPGEEAEIGRHSRRNARICLVINNIIAVLLLHQCTIYPANVEPNKKDGHQVHQGVDPMHHELLK